MGGNLEGDALKLHIAAHALCAVLFLFLAMGCLSRVMEPLSAMQTAPLSNRLQWCSSANVYICFICAVFNLFHITDFEPTMQDLLGSTQAGIVKPLEYLFTCPLMMVTLVVLAGDTVPVSRQTAVASLTTGILLLGFFASVMINMAIKLMFFGTGVMFFCILVYIIGKNVSEHSGGTESLLNFYRHGSPYKALCVKVVATWVLFPIWWVLSADGAKVVEAPEMNTLITSFLNTFAKALYVVFVERLRDRYLGEDSLMAHPEIHPPEIQHALSMAARLGPAGAIQSVVKSIETQEKQVNYIRRLMASDSTKMAAQILTDPDIESGTIKLRGTTSFNCPSLRDESDLAMLEGIGRHGGISPVSHERVWSDIVTSKSNTEGVGILNSVNMNRGGVSRPSQPSNGPNGHGGVTI